MCDLWSVLVWLSSWALLFAEKRERWPHCSDWARELWLATLLLHWRTLRPSRTNMLPQLMAKLFSDSQSRELSRGRSVKLQLENVPVWYFQDVDLTVDEGSYLLFPVQGGSILFGEDNKWTIRKHSTTPIISKKKIVFNKGHISLIWYWIVKAGCRGCWKGKIQRLHMEGLQWKPKGC